MGAPNDEMRMVDDERIQELINQTHALLRQGDPHAALQTVMGALVELGGPDAAAPAASQVRAALLQGQQPGPAASPQVVRQLEGLFTSLSLSSCPQQHAQQRHPAHSQRSHQNQTQNQQLPWPSGAGAHPHQHALQQQQQQMEQGGAMSQQEWQRQMDQEHLLRLQQHHGTELRHVQQATQPDPAKLHPHQSPLHHPQQQQHLHQQQQEQQQQQSPVHQPQQHQQQQQQQQQKMRHQGDQQQGPMSWAAMQAELGLCEQLPFPAGHSSAQQDAAAKASQGSYYCMACGGVVARSRQQAHEDYWCPALHL
eukprot:CAMPEP_0206136640 /NCGR_PEP_ID=MMETSP1473-20131121/1879_1 /ASSEMBLY_ACC=CAM_ASM_001109 /TAXON_ID=1461547 /ORGANISM="Stichococcus sp, Strain RCC1054" /LENGTH=308 /DNA_ID=CAMNT_0053529333 /DNA_START=81 /DNA_END=1007 /DNA_ORIENTATION=-